MTSVLYLIRSLEVGGAQRQLAIQAAGLHDRGYGVSVATFYPGGPFEDYLGQRGVPVHCLRKRSWSDVAEFGLHLIRLVRQVNPDVVYTFMPGANVSAAALKAFWGRRALIWGVRATKDATISYDLRARLTLTASVHLSSRPDAIVANSVAGAKHHIGLGYPASQMRVIPNGIDTAQFDRDDAPARRLRAEWHLAPDERTVGLVGRLHPVKDHVTFFRAMALLIERRQLVRIICVGTGPASELERLRSAAAELGLGGRVEWIAQAPDMPELYRSLDVAVSASFSEGFSNSIAEAMACGTPCVVTDVGDSAMIVGDTGAVVPARDPHAMARAIAQTLAGQTDAEQKALRARIVEKFGVSQLVDRTENVIRDLV